MTVQHSWEFGQGDAITTHLTAMRLLGGGEAYEAYLAFDAITYSPVVVKIVRPGRTFDEPSLRALRREVDALAMVNHPVVVRCLRSVVEGDRPHLVLEQIDGPRLSTLVRRYGPLPEQQYLPLAIEIASALHYFRYVGLVHLDVKPKNIIMGSPARLIDLSIARTADAATELRRPIGTDAYMAPEQCDPPSSGTPGFATDMWALGATLFEVIAGYPPYDRGVAGADGPVVRYPQLVELPYSLPDSVPDDVQKLIYACLERSPANRPLPYELAEGLEPALARVPRGRLAGFKVR